MESGVSLIATAVKHLIAAGITGDALLTAIAEMEAQVRAEPKARSAGALRQARYEERKRQKASEMTLSDETDASDALASGTSLPRLPNENNSNPSTPTHPEEKSRASDAGTHEATGTDLVDADAAAGGKPAKPKRAVSEAIPLPDGWEPVLTPAAQQIVDGWPPGMLDRERMAFEAHAATNDRVTKDWQAAFRTWIAKADRNRTERNGNRSTTAGRGFASPLRADRRDGLQLALDNEIAHHRGTALAS